jgi:succinyl-CoA synthetase beta subunit
MARLHEYQGKELLAAHGLKTPSGRAVKTPDGAREAAAKIGGRVVLKVQAWVTGRKALGGVKFADTPDEAASDAEALLGMRFGNFPVEEVQRSIESIIFHHADFVDFDIAKLLGKMAAKG